MNAQTLVQYKLPVMSSNGCAPLSKHTSKMSLYQQNLKLSILTGRLTTKRKQDGIASGASMIDKLVTLSPHDLAGITLCVKASYSLGSLERAGGDGGRVDDFRF